MAIIKCPECKQNISSTADHCVHCGCKFQICPECGAVSEKSVEVCGGCGYQLVKKEVKPAPKAEKAEEKQSAKDLFNRWSSESTAYRIYESKTPRVIFFAITMFLVVLMIVIMFSKADEGMGAVLGIGYFTIVLSSIVTFARAVYEVVRIYLGRIKFAEWAKYKKVDLRGVALGSFVSDYEKRFPREVMQMGVPHKYTIDAVVFTENKQASFNYKLFGALRLISELVSEIVSTILLIMFLERLAWFGFSLGVVVESMFQGDALIYIIILVISLIAKYFIDKIKTEKHEGEIYLWLKKNAPELIDDYNKYVRDSVKYYEKASQKSVI